MKRIFIYFISIAVIFVGCSKSDISFINDAEEINFPIQSETYGKSVAKEFSMLVKQLNEMGVNYSDADNSPEFRHRLYNDLEQVVSRQPLKNMNFIIHEQITPEAFLEKLNSLTEIQTKFVERIINECNESVSYEDLFRRLIGINKDITVSVPKIQQERLFNITATLFYGAKEIQNMEKQGQMVPTPYNTIRPMRLKSGSEPGDGGGGFWGQCRQISAYVWTLAVGAITHTGEVVKSVTWNPAISLFLVVLCFQGDTNPDRQYCLRQYESCIGAGGPWTVPGSGGAGQTMCDACYKYCLAQGVWDCPRPH